MQSRIIAASLAFGCLVTMSCSKNDSSSAVGAQSTAAPSASAAVAAPAQSAPPTIPAPPDVGAPPADAAKTASGLASKVLVPGTGTVHPGPLDKVKVNYTGWTKDGHMFDSSVLRGQPVTFPLNGVIAGWTEGLQLMVVGEKRRLWLPGALAYGDHPRMGAPGGDLVL